MTHWLWQQAPGLWFGLVALQRDISTDFAGVLAAFAETSDWTLLLAFLPSAVLFGAAHALTPGHSKTVLAALVAGAGVPLRPALRSAMLLAVTHIGMSVLIVLLSLPLVSLAPGEAGRTAALEMLSRGLLGVAGIWLVVQAWRGPGASHDHAGGIAVSAGLIPCPLTLFIMTYASAKGVPVAGLAFAAMMLLGVGAVLAAVAGLAVAARGSAGRLWHGAEVASRLALAATGLFLVLICVLAFSMG